MVKATISTNFTNFTNWFNRFDVLVNKLLNLQTTDFYIYIYKAYFYIAIRMKFNWIKESRQFKRRLTSVRISERMRHYSIWMFRNRLAKSIRYHPSNACMKITHFLPGCLCKIDCINTISKTDPFFARG